MTRTLHDAFVSALRETYDAERQLSKALPRFAKAVTSADLRMTFELHLRETFVHIERLDEVFELLDETPRGKHCQGIAGIVEESKVLLADRFDDYVIDAAIIAAGHRAEHYEIAAYGTLVAWARAMGYRAAGAILQKSLDEEEAAERKLTSLAESGINADAADTPVSVSVIGSSDHPSTAPARTTKRWGALPT
jgi:ferritin-like metal-binding protein YciE